MEISPRKYINEDKKSTTTKIIPINSTNITINSKRIDVSMNSENTYTPTLRLLEPTRKKIKKERDNRN